MISIQQVQEPSNTYDPCEALIMAIIKQSAEDYRRLGRRLKKCHDEEEERIINRKMREISSFFFSDHCEDLTSPGFGPKLLEKLDEEVFGDDECS